MNNFRTEKRVVPIDKVMPNRWNSNYQTPFQFEKQKKSIQDLGFLGSTLVRQIANHTTCEYEIMDGEHRWKACKELGYTEFPVEVIIGEVSDTDARLLTVLINNLRGQDDVFKRAKILEALNEHQLSLLPMTAEEIENEKKFVKFDFSQYDITDEEKLSNQFAKVIVLQMNKSEALVWDRAKDELMSRGLITSKNKKRQDVEMVMRLIKNLIGHVVFDELVSGVDNSVEVSEKVS